MQNPIDLASFIIVSAVVAFFFIILVLVFIARDRLRPYVKSFGLQKAALAYSGNLEELKQTILPVRKSAFTYYEPTIWLYADEGSGAEILMTANRKKDIRIWFQPKTVLRNVHIVLDGQENNLVVSNLMHKRLPPQRIDLEGDFSNHFRLFCNDGQEVIALQIIAPDVMAFLLDNAMDADIEIVEDQVGIIVRNAARSKKHLQNAVDLALQMHTLVKAAAKVTSL